ncbi:N-acetylmuramoyl-L-alanine amidase [Streptomyces piniterrae]|uniref:N-acetylmuramoyl-L-alanine amidase n=1 Tax=Streptomyces piniterrae TaxID=2571125 RepID=A0A4U0NGB2_9ACTN|nr:peptidoglycan-binding protein [Streptomyces piniterrae]TJZ52983.1 N-acetylmuramoyl-L-alanine amidase [Streptomyces piniterrae]
MATPLTASKLLKALHDEGLVVHEVRDWRTHHRNSKGPWGPVHGVMIHHTVTQGTAHSVDLCYDGHPDLPGPLCHGVIDKQGEIHLVGNGRANHAGLGDRDVLRAVIDESELPPDNAADTDGNRHFYGFECINLGNGGDPWPEEQRLAIEKVAAAICRAHGWSERSVIGHKEWQPGKVDPRGFTMGSLRDRIKRRLATPAAGGEGSEPEAGSEPGSGSGSESGSGTGTDSGSDAGGRAPAPPPKPRHPPYEPFPGGGFFHPGARSALIEAMGERLIAEGCGRYKEGPGPEWTEADRKSYAAWQHKLGFKGKDADGVPGKVSWDRLRVPNSQS